MTLLFLVILFVPGFFSVVTHEGSIPHRELLCGTSRSICDVGDSDNRPFDLANYTIKLPMECQSGKMINSGVAFSWEITCWTPTSAIIRICSDSKCSEECVDTPIEDCVTGTKEAVVLKILNPEFPRFQDSPQVYCQLWNCMDVLHSEPFAIAGFSLLVCSLCCYFCCIPFAILLLTYAFLVAYQPLQACGCGISIPVLG